MNNDLVRKYDGIIPCGVFQRFVKDFLMENKYFQYQTMRAAKDWDVDFICAEMDVRAPVFTAGSWE